MNKKVHETIVRLETFIASAPDANALPREAAQFVHALVLATRPRKVLEIGTGYGYSGLWIAAALAETGGHLTTIDHDPKKTQHALEMFQNAGLAEHVQARTGEISDVLGSLTGPFGFVLNDADKENCIRYIELIMNKVVDSAVLLTDNTLTHARQIQPFLDWIRERKDFFSTPVPIGNGMELSIRRM